MEKSYQEILRLLELLGVEPGGLVHRGSTRFLGASDTPCESEAVADLVQRALATDPTGDPLYVAAIGAVTNVASALLLEPDWIRTHLVHSPVVTDQLTWSVDQSRHWIRTATQVNRDAVFGDLFSKLGVRTGLDA